MTPFDLGFSNAFQQNAQQGMSGGIEVRDETFGMTPQEMSVFVESLQKRRQQSTTFGTGNLASASSEGSTEAGGNPFSGFLDTGGQGQQGINSGASQLDPTGITAIALFLKQFTKGKGGVLGAFDDILLPSIDEFASDPKDSALTVASGGVGKAVHGLFSGK